MKKIKLLAVLMLILGGLFFGVMGVRADSDVSGEPTMTISPPKQKIVLIPGEAFEGSIRISNHANANRDLKYSVTIGSFNLGKDENGNVDYNDTDVDTITGYNQIMNWIELGKTSGSVAPNTTDTVPFTINVPEDAPAGGQYATIIFQNDTEEEVGNGNINIQNVLRFASEIFAEVAGETRDEGLIVENNIPAFSMTNKFETTSLVRNNGNVHTDASYMLQVWPLFSDEEICTNEEDPNTSLIMPDTDRYHTESCNLPTIGIFRAKQTVKIFGEFSVAERTVIVCPIWLVFVILFVIVATIVHFVSKARERKSKQ